MEAENERCRWRGCRNEIRNRKSFADRWTRIALRMLHRACTNPLTVVFCLIGEVLRSPGLRQADAYFFDRMTDNGPTERMIP